MDNFLNTIYFKDTAVDLKSPRAIFEYELKRQILLLDLNHIYILNMSFEL